MTWAVLVITKYNNNFFNNYAVFPTVRGDKTGEDKPPPNKNNSTYIRFI